ncbi:MAG: ATP-binding protein, partial [Promethearchaeota archaeon]
IDVSLNGKIQNVSENSQITAVIKDITDIKRSEQKLIESEEKYRNLVETSSMCLLEIDVKNGGIVYINPRLLEIIGYTQEEIINRGLFYKAIFSEDYNKLIRSNDEKKLQFRIRNKDGQIKWLSGRILHHTNEKGELLFLRVWLQDITELKELQEIKTNLLTRISHEIKTPLISIKGFTDLLLNCYKSNLNRKIISYLERIKDGGERLKLLINRFLETKQLEKNLVELNFSYENLSMLIKKEVKDMEGLIKLRNQMVNVDIDDELNNYFDKEKIQSVISNLLINAIKYTPTNGKILIKSHIRKKFIITSIGDNGIGLQEDEIKKLFKPFGKIEKYGKGWDIISDGAGLGLYLSKEIVNLHNGEIWAKSPGLYKGSTFYFSLPLIESI